jgi:hypothetical protein
VACCEVTRPNVDMLAVQSRFCLVTLPTDHTLTAHVHGRCSSLVALDVVYAAANTIAFQGQGVGPSEQRSSLQQQLAMFTASPVLLAPASWPSQCCLTKLTIASVPTGNVSLVADMVHGAVHTPSLRQLKLAQPPEAGRAAFFSSLSALSALTNLTHLSCPQATTDGPLAASPHLPSLQSLHVTAHPSSDIVLPCGTGHLPALTELRLACPGASLHLQQLSDLTSLRHLIITSTACHGHLSHIFPLSQLTTLMLPPRASAAAAAPAAAVAEPQAADAASYVEVPAAWQLGLQVLSWHEPEGAVLPQLTGLTQVWLHDVDVSPKFCWCVCSALPCSHPPLSLPLTLEALHTWRQLLRPQALHCSTIALAPKPCIRDSGVCKRAL